MSDIAAAPHAASADLQLTAAAALLAIAITGIILIRARFPGPLIQRSGRAARRRPSAPALFGRCRWRARGDLNDKDLKGWSCASCGKLRWTSSRSEPPEACL